MKLFSLLQKILFLSLIVVVFSSCGYKPSAKYSRVVVGEKISTSVHISAHDPENTVLIKDSVDSAIIEVFHASLTSKKYSQTHLYLSIGDPRYTPLQYDKDGFVVSYRASITLKIKRESKENVKKYIAKGSYDFSVVANAVITDQERFDAIRYSAAKALRSFMAQVSAEGAREKN